MSKAEELAQWLEEAAGDYSQFDKRIGHEAAALLRKQDEAIKLALELLSKDTGIIAKEEWWKERDAALAKLREVQG